MNLSPRNSSGTKPPSTFGNDGVGLGTIQNHIKISLFSIYTPLSFFLFLAAAPFALLSVLAERGLSSSPHTSADPSHFIQGLMMAGWCVATLSSEHLRGKEGNWLNTIHFQSRLPCFGRHIIAIATGGSCAVTAVLAVWIALHHWLSCPSSASGANVMWTRTGLAILAAVAVLLMTLLFRRRLPPSAVVAATLLWIVASMARSVGGQSSLLTWLNWLLFPVSPIAAIADHSSPMGIPIRAIAAGVLYDAALLLALVATHAQDEPA